MIHIRLLPSSITIYRDITEKTMDVDNGFGFIISMKSHLLPSHRFCHHRYRLHRLPQSHRQLCHPGLIFHQRKRITRCYKLFRLIYFYNENEINYFQRMLLFHFRFLSIKIVISAKNTQLLSTEFKC